VAARWAIVEFFHDAKETWGSGKRQVRNVLSNIVCWNINTSLYGFVELECWDTEMEQVVDRSDRPWDNLNRRLSHADRRRKIALKMLRKLFRAELQPAHQTAKTTELFDELLCLAAQPSTGSTRAGHATSRIFPKVQMGTRTAKLKPWVG